MGDGILYVLLPEVICSLLMPDVTSSLGISCRCGSPMKDMLWGSISSTGGVGNAVWTAVEFRCMSDDAVCCRGFTSGVL